ncbi:MAG TPA: hypothetical protein VJ768_02630, partial [Anaerolineales bacterium]|nr:hypothetical protein [Anaerolineales bacterium]
MNKHGHSLIRQLWPALVLILLVAIMAGSGTVNDALASQSAQSDDPFVSTPVEAELSVAVSSLPMAVNGGQDEHLQRRNPLAEEPDAGKRGTWDRSGAPTDPLISVESGLTGLTPGLDFSFEGIGNPTGCGTCSPPDTNG